MPNFITKTGIHGKREIGKITNGMATINFTMRVGNFDMTGIL